MATGEGSFRLVKFSFKLGFVVRPGEGGTGDLGAQRGALGSASWPESGLRVTTHSASQQTAGDFRNRRPTDPDSEQERVLGNGLSRKVRSEMQVNYYYFESALPCKFKIRVSACFFSPGVWHIDHSQRNERVRV